MKYSLEKLSQVVLVITCLSVMWKLFSTSTEANPFVLDRKINPSIGSELLSQPMPEAGYPFRGQKSLTLYLQEKCPACIASMPSFAELARHKHRGFKVLVYSRSTFSVDYLKKAGLSADAILEAPASPNVRFTPTTLVVNANGLIEYAHVGALDDFSKKAILKALQIRE